MSQKRGYMDYDVAALYSTMSAFLVVERNRQSCDNSLWLSGLQLWVCYTGPKSSSVATAVRCANSTHTACLPDTADTGQPNHHCVTFDAHNTPGSRRSA